MRKGEGIAAAGDILVGGKGVLCRPTFKGPLSHLDRLIVYGRVEEYNVVAFLHTTDITYSIDDIIRVREG